MAEKPELKPGEKMEKRGPRLSLFLKIPCFFKTNFKFPLYNGSIPKKKGSYLIMKQNRLIALLLAGIMLCSTACAARAADSETEIVLSDAKITVDGKTASTDDSAAVYTGAEIVYYRDGTDESYGQGSESEKHSAAEAAEHTVVTITRPGTYRLSGSLSQGQIAVDLGKEARDDPRAVVTLILDNVDVTCAVAPALIFYNVYECDREFVAYDNDENPDYEASPYVDTSAAGANVVIAAGSRNTFTGSHVARIYKEGTTKKLHKYDGAFYSKMSMNIFGDGGDDSGVLSIVADNEGLDSELHLTINGGTVNIKAQDDGINTNEDFVSVTTVNGGRLTVNAGLGAEGDGIDSNGYLVINGGEVWTMANERTPDGGVDADSPILINGGTLYAFGTRNDAADSSSKQPYMELSFASTLPAGSLVELKEGETAVWSARTEKMCQSITLTVPELKLDTPYQLYVDGVLQCWSGNSFGMGRPGGFGGGRPEGMEPPEGFGPGRLPEGIVGAGRPAGPVPEGEGRPDGQQPQEFRRPEGMEPPDDSFGGFAPDGGFSFGGGDQGDGSGSTDFMLTETTKSFSGVCDSDASGKTRISFTVEGAERSGRNTVIRALSAITPSVELDPSLVQVTVNDDPSEDYSASCLLSEGLEAVNALLPTADGKYTLTVAVVSGAEGLTGATQLSFTVGALPFFDLAEGDKGYEEVKALYTAGILKGTSESAFSPAATVTRAQAVTALGRLAGAEEAASELFSDVPSNAWYAGYVGWAVEEGIVEGDGQGHFLPDEIVTARQLELMLGRYAENYVNSTDFSGELTRIQMAQMLADVG